MEGGVEVPGEGPGAGNCPPDKIIIDPQRGLRICLEGGYVIDDSLIDGSPEWRTYGPSEVKGLQRASQRPTFLRHDGLNPGVTYVPKGAAWRDFRAARKRTNRYGALRARRSNIRRRDRPLIDMLTKLHELARTIGINSRPALETASWIIHKYYEERRKQGESEKKTVVINERERWAVAVVALKKAVESLNIPKAENEIYSALAELESPQLAEEIRQYSWKILRRINEYGIKPGRQPVRVGSYPRPATSRISLENQRALARIAPYVRRLVVELGLPPYIADKALSFVRSVVVAKPGKSLSGRKPEAIAAAAVYFMARIYDYSDITQAKAAQVFNLSEANVRKALRYLLKDIVVLVGI